MIKARLLLSACMVMILLVITACHEEDYVFHLVQPESPFPVAPINAPEVIPEEEVGELEPEPLPTPPCEIVKGNISATGRKLYHVEGMANFNQVKIDEAKGEQFFCSIEEAEAAGWVRARN